MVRLSRLFLFVFFPSTFFLFFLYIYSTFFFSFFCVAHSYQWTWDSGNCGLHYQCLMLPNCANILHTDCGWCLADNTAYYGNAQGPLVGTCDGADWVFDSQNCPALPYPEQIHINYGADPTTQMTVTWSTRSSYPNQNSVVFTSAKTGQSVTVAATEVVFNDIVANPQGTSHDCPRDEGTTLTLCCVSVCAGLQFIHTAVMAPLEPGQTYNYYVQSGAYASATYSFSTANAPGSGAEPERWLVLGALGR
jgi:hypothetical protein